MSFTYVFKAHPSSQWPRKQQQPYACASELCIVPQTAQEQAAGREQRTHVLGVRRGGALCQQRGQHARKAAVGLAARAAAVCTRGRRC